MTGGTIIRRLAMLEARETAASSNIMADLRKALDPRAPSDDTDRRLLTPEEENKRETIHEGWRRRLLRPDLPELERELLTALLPRSNNDKQGLTP